MHLMSVKAEEHGSASEGWPRKPISLPIPSLVSRRASAIGGLLSGYFLPFHEPVIVQADGDCMGAFKRSAGRGVSGSTSVCTLFALTGASLLTASLSGSRDN